MKEFFNQLIRSRLFWLGVLVRVALIPTGSSTYLSDLFMPFMDRSIENFGFNPWSLGAPGEFPYGSVLYGVLLPFKLVGFGLFGANSLGLSGLSLTLFKIPLFIADLTLLYALFRLGGRKLYRLILFYWLNPILIVITYGITQLDVVSMAFLFWSLIYLIDKKVLTSALVFGFALLCKFHVALLVPFILAYIWNNYFRNDALARIAAWVSLVCLVGFLGFVPHFLSGAAGYVSGGSPEARRIFGMALYIGENQVFYIGLFAILLLIGRLCFSTKIAAPGLIYGCGALMTTLVLTVNPTEGWYFWFLPFVALLYAQYLSVPRLLLVGMIVSYFLYFQNSTTRVHDVLVNGMLLTILQTFTACFLIAFFVYVLKYDAPIFRRLRPFMIGIGGDSGAGKNHLSESIRSLFGDSNTRTIEGDDYHKWERGNSNWQTLTHLNPLANNLDILLNHSVAMRRGQSVEARHYDHATGKFTEAREVAPAKLIIFQGLHALYSQVFRENLDLKIFLRPSEEIRKAWKVHRDVVERGQKEEKVLETMEKRRPDSEKHIDPQGREADWVISYEEKTENGYRVRHRFKNNPAIHEFFKSLPSLGCSVEIEDVQSEFLQVVIVGNPNADKVRKFTNEHFVSLRQLLRTSTFPVWKTGMDGVHQVILLFLLAMGSQDSSWH